MPPDARELSRRAAAVRRTLRDVESLFAGGGALGIAPEGQGEDVLIEPPAGPGRFLLRLATGVPVLPVGISEQDGALVARFGETYRLAARPGEDRRAEDERIKTEVMSAIAALVPAAARGPYRVEDSKPQNWRFTVEFRSRRNAVAESSRSGGDRP